MSPFKPPNNVPAAPQIYVVHVDFRNVGRLPARNVRWFMDARYWPDFSYGDFRIGEDFVGDGNVIAPGNAMTQGSREIANPIKTGYVFVWSKVLYVDGFDVELYTTFVT